MQARVTLVALLAAASAHAQLATGSAAAIGSSATTPGGAPGQEQYNNGGVFGGFAMAGDCSLVVPAITCTKLNGVAPGVFFSGTNAANLTGTLPAGQLPAASGGDCVSTAGTFSLVCTKTGGVVFGPLATSTTAGRLIKLGSLSGTNFNQTTDNTIAISGSSAYIVSQIIISGCANVGGSFATSAGAFYTGANKTGTALFGMTTTTAFSQVGNGPVVLEASGAPGTTSSRTSPILSGASNIYLSLTTSAGATSATCNIAVFGTDLS